MIRMVRSSHGNSVGLPGFTGLGAGFKVLLILAASLLHCHYLFVTVEEYIENACEFSTVEKVGEGGSLGAEDARAETDTHVVIVHFIALQAGDYFVLEKSHEIECDLAVERRQLVEEI